MFCAAFADLAMFSNVSKHLLNICLFMDRLRGQEGEGILASRLPAGCLGNCAKCRSRRRKKARKCQILVVAQLARLPCAPTKPLGSPNARKQRLNVVRSILFQLAQGDYSPPISLLLVFSPCGLTAMMPAQRLRPYPAQLRLMAIKDGLSPLYTSLPSHSITSNQNKDRFS